ncbi:MAG: acetyl-CoA carboxylase biotin carboxyl carrier protein subunit [Ignavibacteriales bacterium]|nr:acetyl-CoA carboxylase biotin carboxyl carrier protein subunit [Ignavibacteriales bacterium]MCF8316700.1 acetyl-CoA carboxylase biotin carboxyl carrier protein subunit [Ignavibacteriales bacterium]MCF8438342.1 acetyl-CoA carboxylase biotin carboxyl carrier protein subunit [Ignavibacteriales bacterium]
MQNEDRNIKLEVDDTRYETRATTKFLKRERYKVKDPGKITAIIPGLILKLLVKKDQIVTEGQPLLILEAMKMQNTVNSPLSGKISAIHVSEGQKVLKNHLLLEIVR